MRHRLLFALSWFEGGEKLSFAHSTPSEAHRYAVSTLSLIDFLFILYLIYFTTYVAKAIGLMSPALMRPSLEARVNLPLRTSVPNSF